MWEYVLLGILQGVFEWLPVSSEGITALAGSFLVKEINAVDIALFLHLGTLFAVLVYFRKDWKKIISLKDKKLLKFLMIATAASLIIGYPLYIFVREIAVGAVLLLVMGFGLLLTACFHRQKKKFGLKKGSGMAVIAGFLQGLAVVPGLSRSGSTIFGLSLARLSPADILKISYLMSAPVVLVSAVYLAVKNPVLLQGWPALLSGFVVGILSLSALMKIAERINFALFAFVFALLCFAGGIISLLA